MDSTVERAKRELDIAIADALEAALREKCGIHLTEQQRVKLYDFVQFELRP